METAGDDERAAVARWRRASVALEAVRARELAALTDDEALVAVCDLLDLAVDLPFKEGTSGLVEQQRLFALIRS